MAKQPLQALIIRGYCGSGKSTVARQVAQDWQWAFLEYDTFLWSFTSATKPQKRDYEITWLNFTSVLQNFIHGEWNLILEGPLVARSADDPFALDHLLTTLQQAGYQVQLIQLQASPEVLKKRMEARGHQVPEAEQAYFKTAHRQQTHPTEIVIDTSSLTLPQVVKRVKEPVKASPSRL